MGTSSSRPTHRWFAASYDLLAKIDSKRHEELRRYVAGSARGHVLEIGCGTALNLEFYDWTKVDRLDASEPDPFMLRRADQRVASLPPEIRDRVSTHNAAAESLPFPDATFDTVVSTLVLRSVSEPNLAIAEIRRVLKPAGDLQLMEHVRANGILAAVQGAIQPVWGWFDAG